MSSSRCLLARSSARTATGFPLKLASPSGTKMDSSSSETRGSRSSPRSPTTRSAVRSRRDTWVALAGTIGTSPYSRRTPGSARTATGSRRSCGSNARTARCVRRSLVVSTSCAASPTRSPRWCQCAVRSAQARRSTDTERGRGSATRATGSGAWCARPGPWSSARRHRGRRSVVRGAPSPMAVSRTGCSGGSRSTEPPSRVLQVVD